jgi:8-oxo-dGTP pyrophosphatase MutT (NUDIX family)
MLIKYKTSYGIALCRFNKENNFQSEILMIKKRFTYYYFSFVFGLYKKYNNKQLQVLFDNMTFREKIDILSMKFSNMWYRLWLCDPEKNFDINSQYKSNKPNKPIKINDEQMHKNLKCFFRKKNKFESIFLRDGGKRLKRLINDSSNSVTPWEIPKGGMNENELELMCAKREFEEETGISSNHYTILWNIDPIKVSHKDDNTVYNSVYYIAYLNNDSKWQPKVKFNTGNQLTEIEEVRWVALNEIKFLNLNEINKKRLIKNYKKIIYYFKKNIKSNYYDI